MPTFEEIYAQHAAEYDALVSREDYQHRLLPAIEQIIPLAGIDVVEMGAGTGRITKLFAPRVKSIRAFDASAHMLSEAEKSIKVLGLTNVTLQVARNNALPVEDASADLAIAGWSFGHATGWNPDGWRDEIRAAVREMRRVLRPTGTAIIIETMGTGSTEPAPPNAALADYYHLLETELGFSATSIRTDYQFQSLEEAQWLTGFFFGDEMRERVTANQWVILPECTGIWWAKKSP